MCIVVVAVVLLGVCAASSFFSGITISNIVPMVHAISATSVVYALDGCMENGQWPPVIFGSAIGAGCSIVPIVYVHAIKG